MEENIIPVVEEIKAKGKVPVVLKALLGHHIDFDDEADEALDKLIQQYGIAEQEYEGKGISAGVPAIAGKYAAIFAKNSIPVILRKELNLVQTEDWDFKASASIVDVLKSKGLDSQDVVLLADHHIYKIRQYRKKGLFARGIGQKD